MGVGIHGRLEGESVKDYLSRFVRNIPTGLGPPIGNGGVVYFGADEDRLLSTVTVDMSALLPDGLFVRTQVVWDANKVEIPSIPMRAVSFVRHALERLGLEVPTLRPS